MATGCGAREPGHGAGGQKETGREHEARDRFILSTEA